MAKQKLYENIYLDTLKLIRYKLDSNNYKRLKKMLGLTLEI